VSPGPAGRRSGTTAPASPAGGTPEPAGPAATLTPGGGRASLAGLSAAIVAVAATMAVLGWWGLVRSNSMGNDEVATRWAALLPLPQLFHLLSHVDAVHGLYYLLMHPWVAVGSSPAILRIPSVIAMMAAGALTVVLGRQLTGSVWAGLLAGLVMVLTPSVSFYAQTARSYAMVLACVVGSTLALLHALRGEAAGLVSVRRRWAGYAVLVTLGAYLNEMSLLVLAAHGITVLLARYGEPAVRRWLAAAAAGTLLAGPVLLGSLVEHGAIGWIGYPNWPGIKPLLQDYFGMTIVAAVVVVACIAAAVLPGPGGWPGQPGGTDGLTAAPPAWWRSGGISLPSVAVPLLLVPAALLIAESYVLKPLYVDRYVLYGEAGAALLAGGGAYRMGRWLRDAAARRRGVPAGQAAGSWRVLAWAPGIAVCACLLVFQLGAQQHIRTPGSRRYDFGGPSRYVAANARKGDGILYFGTLYRKAELGYPGDFRNTTDFAMAVSPLRAGDFRGIDKPFALTGPLMLHYRRIWVFGIWPSLRIPPGPLRDESNELFRDFTLAGSQQFHGILVTLWVRR
jgi:mannosyltransferase